MLLFLKKVKQVLRRPMTLGHLVLLDYRPNIRSGMFYIQITEKSCAKYYVFSSQGVHPTHPLRLRHRLQ